MNEKATFLVDFFEAFEEEHIKISYRPQWRKITGSVTATILLQQIIFRWQSNKQEDFYKFKEPCPHKLCKENDTWTEELGFSRKEFDTAIKKISFKRTIKNANVKHDKPVEYWIDTSRMTWYKICPENLQKLLKSIYQTKPKQEAEKQPEALQDNDPAVKPKKGFTKSTNGDVVKPKRGATKTPKQDLQVKSEKGVTKSSNGAFPRTKITTEKKTTADSPKKPPVAAALPGFSSVSETELNALINQISVSVSKKRRQWIADCLNDHGYEYVEEKIAYANEKANKKTYWGYLIQAIAEDHGAGFLSDQDPGQDTRTNKPKMSLEDGMFVEINGQQCRIFGGGFVETNSGVIPPGDLRQMISSGQANLIAA